MCVFSNCVLPYKQWCSQHRSRQIFTLLCWLDFPCLTLSLPLTLHTPLSPSHEAGLLALPPFPFPLSPSHELKLADGVRGSDSEPPAVVAPAANAKPDIDATSLAALTAPRVPPPILSLSLPLSPGWTARTLPLVRELVHADGRRAVVVLAAKAKADMDAALLAALPLEERIKAGGARVSCDRCSQRLMPALS